MLRFGLCCLQLLIFVNATSYAFTFQTVPPPSVFLSTASISSSHVSSISNGRGGSSKLRATLSPMDSRAKLGDWELPNRKVDRIQDLSDFQQLVKSTEKHAVAVMFYAPFCKACQAAKPHFDRLARKYNGSVHFLSVVKTDANAKALKALGIKQFPYGRIYDPQGGSMIAELPVIRKLIHRFEDRLQQYVRRKHLITTWRRWMAQWLRLWQFV